MINVMSSAPQSGDFCTYKIKTRVNVNEYDIVL